MKLVRRPYLRAAMLATSVALALVWTAPAGAVEEAGRCDRFAGRTVSQDASGRVLELSAAEFVASLADAHEAGDPWCMTLADDVEVRIPDVPAEASVFGDWSAPAFVSTQALESWMIASIREGSVRARVPDLLGFNYVFESSSTRADLLEVVRVRDVDPGDDVEPPITRRWNWPLAFSLVAFAAGSVYGIKRLR